MFLVVPFQSGALMQDEQRDELLPRDAKILRVLVEADGKPVMWEQLADSAGMIGEWAMSDVQHAICRLKKRFENSLVRIRPVHDVWVIHRGPRHHIGWDIVGPIGIERTVLPIQEMH